MTFTGQDLALMIVREMERVGYDVNDPGKEIPASVPAGQVEREGSINSGAVSSTIADPPPSHAGDDGVKRQVRVRVGCDRIGNSAGLGVEFRGERFNSGRIIGRIAKLLGEALHQRHDGIGYGLGALDGGGEVIEFFGHFQKPFVDDVVTHGEVLDDREQQPISEAVKHGGEPSRFVRRFLAEAHAKQRQRLGDDVEQ